MLLTGLTDVLGEKPAMCTFFPHHKFHVGWPGIESGPLRREAGS